jgi:hypothetical protein
MAMERIAGLLAKVFILVLAAVLPVAGVSACGKSPSITATGFEYKLVHNLPDLEYILPWDTIEARIPDLNDYTKYEKDEAYMGRGNSGGFTSLDSNSPAMWAIVRMVKKLPEGTKMRLSVFMWYFDTEKEFDEHLNAIQTQGISIQKEGDFSTAIVAQETSVQSAQLVVAGNRICILMDNVASPDESLVFNKEDLTALLPTLKSKMSSIELTPLPYPKIPRK